MECGAVWVGNLDHQEGGYQEVGGLGDVDMATNGEDQLDGAHDK